jgi:PAS domain S-box-containing protein
MPLKAPTGRSSAQRIPGPGIGLAALLAVAGLPAPGRAAVTPPLLSSPRAADPAPSTRLLWLAAGGAVAGGVLLTGALGTGALALRRRERRHAAELHQLHAQLEAQASAHATAAAEASRRHTYFAASPIGYVVVRRADTGEFIVEDVNPAGETLYGLDRARCLGHAARELWPEPVAKEAAPHLRRCLTEQRLVTYSLGRARNGVMRALDVSLTPLPESSGAPCRVLCAVQDVTAQRDLERQALRETERRSEVMQREPALFRHNPDVLAMIRVQDHSDGPHFVYEALSGNLDSLTELPPDHVIGCQPADVLPAALAEEVAANYRRCLAEGTTVRYALSFTLPSGSRECEGIITPVRHPATGRIVHLADVLRDVTERNRAGAALRHGQKMEALGRLAAGVAHDFNNVLQAVSGGLELLLDTLPEGEEAEALASTALSTAQRGSYLTHHLLCYTRRQVMQPQDLDPGPFLTELQGLLTHTLGPHLRIEVRMDPPPPALRADPSQLQTALLNLAINAADAMPKGGVLTLAADELRNADGRWVELAVIDTGIGMDSNILARAFEPFFTTKGSDGVGLGLAMVRSFAEQSGGAVRISSVQGIGTTVVLRLPAAAVVEAAPSRARHRPRAEGRVLLVDDAPDVLLTTSAFLAGAGLTVVRAADGDQVLALLSQGERFDAVVSDYAMPGMNGIDLIHEIRNVQPDLPAVIITGYADLGGGGGTLPDGAAVLYKPFARDRLLHALRGVMARKAAPSEPAAPPAASARQVLTESAGRTA